MNPNIGMDILSNLSAVPASLRMLADDFGLETEQKVRLALNKACEKHGIKLHFDAENIQEGGILMRRKTVCIRRADKNRVRRICEDYVQKQEQEQKQASRETVAA